MVKLKTEKSKLVKKFHENLAWTSFSNALNSRQKGRGIYILYKQGKIYYVGLSKRSLRGRIRRHALRDRHKGKWDTFSFYQIGKVKYIKDIESLLLRIISPKGNKIAGRFQRKYNLAKT
ncbi:MAG: excinuclease ABC subunit C [Parcubacteria group bacterium Gr01-1014_33]|nr:MAG: excinuclease ABC subunit C [Parcubacteria group bacterium Gr01-1014_33]